MCVFMYFLIGQIPQFNVFYLYFTLRFLLCRFVAAITMQLEWLWWLSHPFSVVAGWGVSIQYSVVWVFSRAGILYTRRSSSPRAVLWLPLPSYSLSHKLPNTPACHLFHSGIQPLQVYTVILYSLFKSQENYCTIIRGWFKKHLQRHVAIDLVWWAML